MSGLFLDIIIGKNLGQTALMLSIVGVIGAYLEKNFSKESKMTILLMVIGTTIIYETGLYILQIIKLSINVAISQFIYTLLIEVIYNIILTIILYPIIQKYGYKLEHTFKEQKILTRYF